MTYGSAMGADTPGDEPALIEAQGHRADGSAVQGYVKRDDLELPAPANPEAAVARTRQLAAAGGRRTVKLYTADGATVIGTFTLHSSASATG